MKNLALVAIITVGLVGVAVWHSVNYMIDKVWAFTPNPLKSPSL